MGLISHLLYIAILSLYASTYRGHNTCRLTFIFTNRYLPNGINSDRTKLAPMNTRFGVSNGGPNISDVVEENDDIDYKKRMELEESSSVDYIDNKLEQSVEDVATDNSEYFDWDSINKRFPETLDDDGTYDSQLDKTDVGEGESTKEESSPRDDDYYTETVGSDIKEHGERPIIAGHGLDMECHIENYEIGSTSGRLNEWPVDWTPGTKVMSFFPILIDEYSLHPSPLQIGFEEAIRFRGRHVESTFNSLIDKLERKLENGDVEVDDVYGLCFLNPNTGQLAPLGVYAKLLSKKAIVDGGGESLEVVGRVLGRVMISRVILEEPFIKATITPVEDKPGLGDPDGIPKIVDEITNLHSQCNNLEAEIMALLQQHYAVSRIKSRPNLHDVIDDRLNKFNVNITNSLQAFAQLAAYAAFDHHITAAERYDSLTMQNTEDRLRFIRDNLKMKVKQLNILKSAPQDKLDDMMRQLRDFQFSRDDLYNDPRNTEANEEGNEDESKLIL